LNCVVHGSDILGKDAAAISDYMTGVNDVGTLIRTAETFLLSRLAEVPATHNYVREACRLIRNTNGGLSVDALSSKLYISKRQLERGFKQQMGATPKTYQRMIRFRAAYRYARSREAAGLRWTDVSYESGYSDQAHFIREFREFTGETPGILAHNREIFFQTLEAC
jgi:AraC-like DNA-binding protein